MDRPGATPDAAPRGRAHRRGRPRRPGPARVDATSTASSATTRSRSASTTGTASTPSGWSRGIRTGCSTRTRQPSPASARGRAPDGAVVLQPPAARAPTPARGDAARLLGPPPLERPACQRRAVHGRGAPAPSTRGRAHRELGPHGREGAHLAVLRPVRRPERRDGARPSPVPPDRLGTGTGHGMAADRPAPLSQTACRVRGAPRAPRSGARAPLRSSPATRPATRRTRRGSSSASSRGVTRAPPCARSCSSGPIPATRVARAVRRAEDREGIRPGRELHGRRRPRHAAPARRRRSLQRRDDPPRRPRRRSSGRVVLYDEGARPGSHGRRRTSSASTTKSSPPPARSTVPSPSRRSPLGSSGRSAPPTSCLPSGRGPSEQVVGRVDGRAAARVVDAVAEGLASS